MARAYACDICGALYKEPNYSRSSAIGIWTGNYNAPKVADLCPECKAALEDWIKERNRGYEDKIVSAAD